MAVVDADSLYGYWATGRLFLPSCSSCGRSQMPPGPVCSHCGATDVALAEVSGRASVVSWSTVHRAPLPAYNADLPYTVVLVETVEGALVELRLEAESTAAALTIGQPVDVVIGVSGDRNVLVARVDSLYGAEERS